MGAYRGKVAYVGITDYAQHSLGDITFVDLPKIGETVKQAAYCYSGIGKSCFRCLCACVGKGQR